MKALFGSIIVDGSGKIAGHVVSKNRGGSYIKTKKTPINPQSPNQIVVRNRLKQFSQAWKSLTAAQRTAWNTAVDQYKKTDIFGNLRRPSGLNLFCMLNCNLASVGVSMISDPPTPTAVPAIATGSATVVGATGVVTATFTPTVPAGVAMVINATAQQSAGKSYVTGKYRFIKSIAAAQTSPQVITTEYAAKVGAPSAVGQVVHFKMRYINITTGVPGPVIAFSATIS